MRALHRASSQNATTCAGRCPATPQYLTDVGDERSVTAGEDDSSGLREYERIVAERPDDAHALVDLANAYWLSGRGPEVVGALAARAIAADATHRGAWHLWAISESSPRERVARWHDVSSRFPDDDLARANLADNAAALAGAEQDAGALALAISTYEAMLTTATREEERTALTQAIATLKEWKL